MGKKFMRLLESKHRNQTKTSMSESAAYTVVHEICTNKQMDSALKMKLIDDFCHERVTVSDVYNQLREFDENNF